MVDQIASQDGNMQENWKPLPPINFTVLGKEGIQLTDAIDPYFSGLDGCEDPVPGGSWEPRVRVHEHYYVGFHYYSITFQSLYLISLWDII